VAGPGALPLLERASGNLIDRPIGSVVYTQFLERDGGMAADLTVTRLAEQHFRVVTGAGYVNSDMGWLRMQVREDDAPVEIRETSEELSVIGLWGPRSPEILAEVTGDKIAFPFMHARYVRIHGAKVLAQRVTYVGEMGWELYAEPHWAGQVWDRLIEAGSPLGLRPGGYRALDSLRMEKGYRYYGTDLTLLDTPYEAGLGFCVDGKKWPSLKREVKRRLRTLVVGDHDYLTLYGGEAVHADGGVVGRVRSCAYGFTARANIAYSYLPVEIGPGARVDVEVFGELVPAVVTSDAVVAKSGVAAR
jgi:glycine cleavage system aminomethyltransferase T